MARSLNVFSNPHVNQDMNARKFLRDDFATFIILIERVRKLRYMQWELSFTLQGNHAFNVIALEKCT